MKDVLNTDDLRGAFIRKLLKIRGWSQGGLAHASGVDAHDISRITLGKMAITEHVADLLSEAFGIDPGLLKGHPLYLVDRSLLISFGLLQVKTEPAPLNASMTVEVRQVLASCLTECAQRLAPTPELQENTQDEDNSTWLDRLKALKSTQELWMEDC